MQFLRYIFYRVYSWNVKIGDIAKEPQHSSVLGFSFLIFANILSLTLGLLICTGSSFPELNDFHKIVIAFIALAIYYTCHFLLVKDGKYLEIVEEFKDEKVFSKKRGDLYFRLYVAGSLALPFLIGFLRYILK